MLLKLSRAFTSYGNYRMSTLWRKAPKSSEEPLVEVNAGEVTLERPTVIFLTGVSTTVKYLAPLALQTDKQPEVQCLGKMHGMSHSILPLQN